MEQLIRRYKCREITFSEFVAGTEKYWCTMADDMLRKWDHPAAVERDDLVQEMLLSAWKGLDSWQDGKGVTGKQWVVFGAMKSARRWFHVQRGAKSFARCSGDKDPSPRYPVREADVETSQLESAVSAWSAERALLPQGEAMSIAEFERLAQNDVDREVILALQEAASSREIEVLLAMFQRAGRPNNPRTKRFKRGSVRISGTDLKNAKVAYFEYIEWLAEEAANV